MTARGRGEAVSAAVYYESAVDAYENLRNVRERYLRAVEDVIFGQVQFCGALVDIGCADAFRTARLAARLGCDDILLVEPSPGMLALAKSRLPTAWTLPLRAEKAPLPLARFDVALCLWNVLGHIETDYRVPALQRIANSLSSDGLFFIDVNNRQNVAEYGWKAVRNFVTDCLRPERDSAGDFLIHLNATDLVEVSTVSHLFSYPELRNLLLAAGLRITASWCIDYTTGRPRRTRFGGQLLIRAEVG